MRDWPAENLVDESGFNITETQVELEELANELVTVLKRVLIESRPEILFLQSVKEFVDSLDVFGRKLGLDPFDISVQGSSFPEFPFTGNSWQTGDYVFVVGHHSPKSIFLVTGLRYSLIRASKDSAVRSMK